MIPIARMIPIIGNILFNKRLVRIELFIFGANRYYKAGARHGMIDKRVFLAVIPAFAIVLLSWPSDDPFETITDTFESPSYWDTENIVIPYDGHYEEFSEYIFTLDRSNKDYAPSALISGDGFVSFASMSRTIDISKVIEGDDLYLAVDYRAVSDTDDDIVTNALLDIYDADGNMLYEEWMASGGTRDTMWKSYERNIAKDVTGHDVIVIRISLKDNWIANWNQKLYVDNFYLSTEPRSGADPRWY